ncbi:MAG: ABC transporter permease, partial [bacterium]|nr:ABC transporter permease [bacterium]
MHPVEHIADLLRQTVANVWRNKLRSFLTLFGIAWGIASLVLMSALSDGFRVGQRQNMSQLGDNIVFVFPGRTEMQAGGERAGRRVFLYQSDVAAIRDQCPAVEVVAGEQKTYGVAVRSAHNAGEFLTVGISPEYLQLRNLWLEKGRHPSVADLAEARRVAVIGAEVRKQLFEERPDVIGETIRINGYPYRVIGYMAEKNQNSSYDGWDNDKVLIPATSLRRDTPPDRQVYSQNRVNVIIYRPASVQQWELAQHQVKSVLGRIHNFDPRDETAVNMWDTVEGAEMTDQIFDSMEIFLAAVALVTLSLGGVGVMNTMMMAVSERTNEIGLKKALGATRGRILVDFFSEGLLLAILSGISGMVLILLLAAGVNTLPPSAMFAGLPIQWSTLGLAT